jgi:RND family efflux transporter MFP subunit
MSKKKIIWGTVLAVTVVGFGSFGVYKANKSIDVSVTKISEGMLAEKVFASGKLEATRETSYYTPQSGVVAQIKVKPGDKVKKGQVLFSMNTSDLEQQLDMENNNLKIAQLERDDAKKQNDQSSSNPLVPKQSVDLAAYDLKVQNAQKTVDSLQKKIAASEVVATSDGVVIDVPVKVGQAAAEGTPVLTAINQDGMQVRANLNELDSGKVKTSEPAKVTGDGFGGTYDGKVIYLSPIAAPASPTSKDPVVEMVVLMNKTAAELRPGYSASVEIDLPADKHLLAPLSAVKREGDKAYVFKIDTASKAQRVDVKTGKEDDDNVEILSGLTAGDEIINHVPDNLTAGKKVSAQ